MSQSNLGYSEWLFEIVFIFQDSLTESKSPSILVYLKGMPFCFHLLLCVFVVPDIK